jgi:hypothetical protein
MQGASFHAHADVEYRQWLAIIVASHVEDIREGQRYSRRLLVPPERAQVDHEHLVTDPRNRGSEIVVELAKSQIDMRTTARCLLQFDPYFSAPTLNVSRMAFPFLSEVG